MEICRKQAVELESCKVAKVEALFFLTRTYACARERIVHTGKFDFELFSHTYVRVRERDLKNRLTLRKTRASDSGNLKSKLYISCYSLRLEVISLYKSTGPQCHIFVSSFSNSLYVSDE